MCSAASEEVVPSEAARAELAGTSRVSVVVFRGALEVSARVALDAEDERVVGSGSFFAFLAFFSCLTGFFSLSLSLSESDDESLELDESLSLELSESEEESDSESLESSLLLSSLSEEEEAEEESSSEVSAFFDFLAAGFSPSSSEDSEEEESLEEEAGALRFLEGFLSDSDSESDSESEDSLSLSLLSLASEESSAVVVASVERDSKRAVNEVFPSLVRERP